MPENEKTPTLRSAYCVRLRSLSYTRSADPMQVVMVMQVGELVFHVRRQASKPHPGLANPFREQYSEGLAR
ncbi:MAG: hypothetical protein ACRDWA_11815 [Acidimicrobiia bacterium]